MMGAASPQSPFQLQYIDILAVIIGASLTLLLAHLVYIIKKRLRPSYITKVALILNHHVLEPPF
jgi:hypothetical protein